MRAYRICQTPRRAYVRVSVCALHSPSARNSEPRHTHTRAQARIRTHTPTRKHTRTDHLLRETVFGPPMYTDNVAAAASSSVVTIIITITTIVKMTIVNNGLMCLEKSVTRVVHRLLCKSFVPPRHCYECIVGINVVCIT